MKAVAVIGSITTATRIGKILERKYGIRVTVFHTPAEISGGSCSYSVRGNAETLSYIKETVKNNGIKVRAYYMEENRNGEKVYHAVS